MSLGTARAFMFGAQDLIKEDSHTVLRPGRDERLRLVERKQPRGF